MRTFLQLMLLAGLSAPSWAQFAPVVWPGQGWPAPWPQIVWVPVAPPYFMWPVPQWPAMPMPPYPADAMIRPIAPIAIPPMPDAGAAVPTGNAPTAAVTTSVASEPSPAGQLVESAPKTGPAKAEVLGPLSAPPLAKSAAAKTVKSVKPKVRRAATAPSKSKGKPRRLCWSNGVVDACPK